MHFHDKILNNKLFMFDSVIAKVFISPSFQYDIKFMMSVTCRMGLKNEVLINPTLNIGVFDI